MSEPFVTSDRYVFRANGRWTSDGRGDVQADPPAGRISFSAPPEFRGPSGFWTPEHFLLAAVVSCFITTFRAVAAASKFDFVSLSLSAEGTVEKQDGGYQFTRVVVKPRLDVLGEAARERALHLLRKTERACLVSRSLKAEVVMETVIETAERPWTIESHFIGSSAPEPVHKN